MIKIHAAIATAGFALLATIAPANDEAGAIQNRRGDASPSATASNINDYTQQDEQLNLGPDDQDVLVLRANQKVLLNRYVTATIPLRHAHPREIRSVFRELTAKEGGRAEIIRDKNTNENFLQVVAPKWQIPFIEQAVAVLDLEWVEEYNDGAQTTYYRAKHRAIAAIDSLARNWGGDGFSQLDATNNAVIRFDEPYRVGEYLKGAKTVDVPEHQGRFRVKIYEIVATNDLRLGLDYIAWKNGPGSNLFGFGSAGYYAEQRSDTVGGLLTPFAPRVAEQALGSVEHYFRNADRWAHVNFLLTAAYVDFLASKGKAKTLAEGTIQVRSGSTGNFSAVDQVVTFVARPVDPTADGTRATPIRDAEDETDAEYLTLHNRTLNREDTGDVGINVSLAPVIQTESTELSIHATVSSVTGYTPQGLPIINRAETRTKARVRDGSTLVISGLSRGEKIESGSGMPGLGALPVVGWLFGGENNIARDKHIVIVIESECETGGESTLADLEEIRTTAAQVAGEAELPLPGNAFGFDQWLLGPGSGGRL